MENILESIPGIRRRWEIKIKRLFDQKIHLFQKRFRWVIGQQNRSLHGHHADGKSIRVLHLDPFFDLLHQPRFARLPGRPDREVMTAFFRIADKLFHASIDQFGSRNTEMDVFINGAIRVKSAHGFILCCTETIH